ncbi:MAG: acyl-ACP--UDP-N-acetylglucosamine O-acyltransferase [Phycisphaerae bacterium]
MPSIHPTAVVGPDVQLADDVSVGPYAIIQGKVTIGPGTRVLPHTVINGTTVIGARCTLGPAAYVGMDPQHLGYKGEETWLVVGDDVVVRETGTLHRSMKPGIENATRLGNKVYVMANAHVGHDCRVADSVILAHGSMLGGHVEIGEKAFLGGGGGIHQFCRVGRLAIVRGNDSTIKDVPPFAAYSYSGLKGYNAIGVRRSGMPRESVQAIRKAYTILHAHRNTAIAVAEIERDVPSVPEVGEILTFIKSSKRGIALSVRSLYSAMAAGDDGDGDE